MGETENNTADRIREEKARLRRAVKERRRSLGDARRERLSDLIADRIAHLPEYAAAEAVFVYMDISDEVRTGPVIARCRADGKRIAIPRVEGKELRFYEITDLLEKPPETFLTEGYLHIPEPDPQQCPCADAEETALMILPGLAFDRQMHRLGYGGGFYDRYLAAHPHHPTVAPAFSCQLFERIPFEETDICVDRVITAEE